MTRTVVQGPYDITTNASALPAPGSPGVDTVLRAASADGEIGSIAMECFGANGSIVVRRANGAAAAPTALMNGDFIGGFGVQGYGATEYGYVSKGALGAYATENWTDSATGCRLTLGGTPKGTATRIIAAEIEDTGQLITHYGAADQSFVYSVPGEAFSITVANGSTGVILEPAATLNAGTITMPSLPIDGQIVSGSTTAAISAVTVAPNAGQSVKNATFALASGGGFRFIYVAAKATWYRMN